MKKLLAAFAALALIGTVQVGTSLPAQAAETHSINHFEGPFSPRYMLVGNGQGQIYYLQANTTRANVHRAFIPIGCRGYEVQPTWMPGIFKTTTFFGEGPRWADLSGHTHTSRYNNSTHYVKISC